MNKIKQLKLSNLIWVDAVSVKNEEKLNVIKPYNFHELDVEAILEENQFPRVNAYEDYLFIIFHFPKYIKTTQTYVVNEFNIFLGKNFLIIFRDYLSSHINRIFNNYQYGKIKVNKKTNSVYILYEIMQVMLEKMFKVIHNLNKDLKQLEKEIFAATAPS